MKIPRAFLNYLCFQVLKGKDPVYRRMDARILSVISQILKAMKFHNADVFREDLFLNMVQLIAESIFETPAGLPLTFPFPAFLTLSITNRCPFECQVCYANSLNTPSGQYDVSNEIITRLISSPSFNFLLTGGEPMLHPDIIEIIEQFLSARKEIYLATSVSIRKLRPILLKYPNKLNVLMSVWGDKEQHDKIRGPGSYDRLFRMIKEWTLLPVRGCIICTISDASMTALDTLEEIIKIIDLRYIFISRPMHIGRFNQIPVSWDQENTCSLLEKCRKIKRRFGKRIYLNIPEITNLYTNTWVVDFLLKFFEVKFPKRCGVGYWTVHVDASGNLYPCLGCETKRPYGNLLERPLEEIWHEIQLSSLQIFKPGTCPIENSF